LTVEALIAAAQEAGVELVADGDHLRIRPAGILPPELKAELSAEKRAVLAALRDRPSASPCNQCGSTTWVVSLVVAGGERVCSSCALGRTQLEVRS
jgi:hypothetical protein